jgi:hypothetical protein
MRSDQLIDSKTESTHADSGLRSGVMAECVFGSFISVFSGWLSQAEIMVKMINHDRSIRRIDFFTFQIYKPKEGFLKRMSKTFQRMQVIQNQDTTNIFYAKF